jgi:hypothetical protein
MGEKTMRTKSFLSLILGFAMVCLLNVNINAQTTDSQVNPRLYIVTQSATNCTMCTDNQTRWNSDIVNHYSTDPGYVFINYDITDDASMLRTRTDLDRYGIYNSLSTYNTPGSVILIDPVTKQVVGSTTMGASTEDILKSINGGSPSPTK